MKDQQTQAAKIVKSIADKLLFETPNDVGLYNGASGIALFLAYYYLYTHEDKYGEKAVTLLETAVANPTQGGVSATLYKGMAGVGWTLQHLTNIGFMDEEVTYQLNDWDHLIFESAINDLNNKNYDLMHGAIGKGVYFIERLAGNVDTRPKLEKLTESILHLSHQASQEIYWPLNGSPDIVNIGMAHGMASIMRFLGEAYKLDIQPAACKAAIQGALDWFWARELSDKKSKFAVEYQTNNQPPSKGSFLHWCHGDLGILTLLGWMKQQTPELLREVDLEKFHKLLEFDSKRTLKDAGIAQSEEHIESIFCHGLAGIGYIFHQLASTHQLPAAQATAHYWLELLVQEWKPQHYAYGYQTRNGKHRPDGTTFYFWEDNTSLHNGAAGIALVLLKTYLLPQNQERPWDLYAFTNM